MWRRGHPYRVVNVFELYGERAVVTVEFAV